MNENNPKVKQIICCKVSGDLLDWFEKRCLIDLRDFVGLRRNDADHTGPVWESDAAHILEVVLGAEGRQGILKHLLDAGGLTPETAA